MPDHWPVCEKKKESCTDNFLNLLACECFSAIQCMMMCPEGEVLDPAKGCSCITDEEARAYYPADATDRDIKHSFNLMYEELEPK